MTVAGDRVHYEMAPPPYRRPAVCAFCGGRIVEGPIEYGPIRIEEEALYIDGRLSRAKRRQSSIIKILRVFMSFPEKVLTYPAILNVISDHPYDVGADLVQVGVYHARNAIYPYRDMIQNIRGVGFKMVPAETITPKEGPGT